MYALFAQTSPSIPPTWLIGLMITALVLLVLVVPFLLGGWLAKSLRMPEHGWRIGLVLMSLIGSIVIIFPKPSYLGAGWPPKWGTDLAGGVILVFEVDLEQSRATGGDDAGAINMDALIEALKNRLNPAGTKEIVIRKFGERQVEIVIPEVDPLEVEEIKKQIKQAGNLEFRIVATKQDHPTLIASAQAQSRDPDQNVRKSTLIQDTDGKRVLGRWVTIGRDDSDEKSLRIGRALDYTIRNAVTGEIIEPERVPGRDLEAYLKREGIVEVQILMDTSDSQNVTGADLGSVARGTDERGGNEVEFNLKNNSARRMDLFTGNNVGKEMGIVLDNSLLSAAKIQSRISDRGRITGNFSGEEVDFLVSILRAGRLPAVLNKEPVSQNLIDPLLGKDMILKGQISIALSLVAVMVFMAVYYRASGVVANFAVLLNIGLIVAVMILIKAPFTLPGLAGLVLTVGMAVDANVLISERMREELGKGSSLRLVIRNGFDRAFATIVDSNLTTLITSITLYIIGTDTVRGFAVTLTLGILFSMFTAVFCARVVFEVCERQRWLTTLKMARFFDRTNIDFMAIAKTCITVSLVLIVLGFAATAYRGSGMLDIDFLGGTTVQPIMRTAQNSSFLREKLDAAFDNEGIDYTLTKVQVAQDLSLADRVFKIDTSIRKKSELEAVLAKVLVDDQGKSLIATYTMSYSPPVSIELTLGGEKPVPAEPKSSESSTTDGAGDTAQGPGDTAQGPGDTAQGPKKPVACGLSPDDDPPASGQEQPAAKEAPPESADKPAPDKPAPDKPAQGDAGQPASGEKASSQPTQESARVKRMAESILKFEQAINAVTLQGRIEDVLTKQNLTRPEIQLIPSVETNTPNAAHTEWKVRMSTSLEDAERILSVVRSDLEKTSVFISSSEIGSAVAGDTKSRAILAMLASLVGITLYVWFRFHSVVWGFAAVLALVHDVCIMLGAIAVSYWLAGPMSFLLVEEFKINLVIIAAFLTLVGYSINDTIVVFDRLREEKGKSQKLTPQIVNDGINLTLSRTTLTSLTTFIVVVILYFTGGQSIHGFAFSLVVGIVVGTYSSIFIAAPLLIYFGEKDAVTGPGNRGQIAKKAAVGDR
jgi:SecD/SecF fusion protein